MKNTVSIKENKKILSFTYEELLACHGGAMPGGVALAFRMLQWVFEEVLQTIPERGLCQFYSGLGENGRGIIDTVKKVLGVVENESLRLDKTYSLNKTGPMAPGGGRGSRLCRLRQLQAIKMTKKKSPKGLFFICLIIRIDHCCLLQE